MSFLYPGYLWWLLLVIPLLFTFRRLRFRQKVVSSLIGWGLNVSPYVSGKQHPDNRFSVLYRCLIVSFLVLAAARPVVHKEEALYALVIDNSPSMFRLGDDGTLLIDRAIQAALQYLHQLPEDARVSVWINQNLAIPLLFNVHTFEAADTLDTWEPAPSEDILHHSFLSAIEWFSGKEGTLVYLGDGALLSQPPSMPVSVHPKKRIFSTTKANCTLTLNRVQFLAKGSILDIGFSVLHRGGASTRRVPWQIVAGEHILSSGNLHIQPGGIRVISRSLFIGRPISELSINLKITDACELDNSVHYKAPVPMKARIGTYLHEPSPSLAAVLHSFPDYEVIPVNSLSTSKDRLDILIAETSPGEIAKFDLPALVFSKIPSSAKNMKSKITYYNRNHPILHGVDLLHFPINIISTREREKSPAIVLASAGIQPVITCSSANTKVIRCGWDLRSAQILRTPAFPIFVDNAVQWLLESKYASLQNLFFTQSGVGNALEFVQPCRPLESFRSLEIPGSSIPLPIWYLPGFVALILLCAEPYFLRGTG